MHKRYVILAPHVDDEMIGCSEILRFHPEDTLVIYGETSTRKRKVEGLFVAEAMGFKMKVLCEQNNFLLEIQDYISMGEIIFAPDPHWERHPLHKKIGMFAQRATEMARKRFITYSTNMNTPYLKELSEEHSLWKERHLREFYPSQKDLWGSDAQFWLFEGMAEWNPNFTE